MGLWAGFVYNRGYENDNEDKRKAEMGGGGGDLFILVVGTK